MENVEKYMTMGMDMAMVYLPKVLLAIIVLIVGLKVIGMVVNGMVKVLNKRDTDPSLIPFLSGLIGITLKIMLIISVVQMIGVETTSFIAIIGAAGLAIGMALSGTLQNFAGGVIILILKPFKIGDVLEAQGFIGSVSEIQIFNTVLKTWDNKTVIIPNGGLSTGSMINYSTEPTRVVEWIVGIGYNDDIDKARQVIESTIFSDERILNTKEEGYFINVFELADSSVNFKVRAKVNAGDYWAVLFDNTEKIKKALDANGISIPFPQRDVHMHTVK